MEVGLPCFSWYNIAQDTQMIMYLSFSVSTTLDPKKKLKSQ